MRRVIGSWLDGPKAALNDAREHADDERPQWRGEGLGLPASGSGSAAPTGRRALAFLVDILLAGLVTWAFTAPDVPGNYSVIGWFVITVVPVSLAGATPGMMLLRIWVARVDGATFVGPWRAIVRCLLSFLVIPAVVWNLDGRSWHDRLTGTLVLNR
ncbi:RDD family protein [Saccharopolyspora montiporae]|uniref:RDD family protein n=1 Tax=Saccharopolyspora montiporae TaxID=2781240 RepID=UPI00351C564E